MENDVMEISLSQIWEVIKKTWLTGILLVVVGAALAFGFTKIFIEKTYTAEAKIIIVQQRDSALNQSMSINDINLNQKLVSTYTQIMRSEAITDVVLANLGLYEMTNKDINALVSITNANNTEVMNIAATTTDPLLSAELANEMVNVFKEQIFDIMQIENVSVLNPAKVPTIPSGPKTATNTLIGMMLGFVIYGIILIIMLMTDTKVKTEDELKAVIDYPIIGYIPDTEIGRASGRERVYVME